MRVRIAAAAYLLLHVLVYLQVFPCAWGADQLLYLPAAIAWLTLGVAAALVGFPALSRSAAQAAPPGMRPGWAPRLPPAASYVLLAVCCAASFWLLRAGTALLGDGLTYLRQLPLSAQSGMLQSEHEPLTFFFVRGIYSVLRHSRSAAWTAYAAYSIGSGVLYACAALYLARLLSNERRTRYLLLGLLLSQGYIALFCGYVETYPLLAAMVLCYMASATAALRGRAPLIIPVLISGCLIVLHYSTLTLLPSLGALCALAPRGRAGDSDSKRSSGIRALAGPLVAIAIAAAALYAFRQSRGLLRDFMPAGTLLPLPGAARDGFRQLYGIFSPRHLVDLLNEAALAAPAVVIGVLAAAFGPVKGWMARIRRGDTFWFFLFACTIPLATFALLNPAIGAFRDWDLFAWPLIPVVVWIVLLLADHIPARPELGAWCMAAIIASGMHTTLWLAVNASHGTSVARFSRLLSRCPLSSYASAYGWESLGSLYRDEGHARPAADAYEKAASADPANPRYWDLAGLCHAQMGDTSRAIAYMQRSIRLAPRSHAEAYGNLGSLYLGRGELDSAIVAYRGALGIDPRVDYAMKGLMDALARKGDREQALEVAKKRLALNPGSADVLRDAASLALDAGDLEMAEDAARRVLMLQPRDAKAHAMIGECLFRRGLYQQAIGEWDAAMPEFPAKAWLRQRIEMARTRAQAQRPGRRVP